MYSTFFAPRFARPQVCGGTWYRRGAAIAGKGVSIERGVIDCCARCHLPPWSSIMWRHMPAEIVCLYVCQKITTHVEGAVSGFVVVRRRDNRCSSAYSTSRIAFKLLRFIRFPSTRSNINHISCGMIRLAYTSWRRSDEMSRQNVTNLYRFLGLTWHRLASLLRSPTAASTAETRNVNIYDCVPCCHCRLNRLQSVFPHMCASFSCFCACVFGSYK